jgi:protein-tyrosine phosphatase
MARLHWIEIAASGRLAISARPRADDWLETEIAEWKTEGLDVVVSLLEGEEVSELGLRREPELCRLHGIEFVSFPIADRGLPASRRDALQLAHFISGGIAAGRSIMVHCRAGIGRSSIVAACGLIGLGIGADRALELIKDARGVSVPDTEEQHDWIVAFEAAQRMADR